MLTTLLMQPPLTFFRALRISRLCRGLAYTAPALIFHAHKRYRAYDTHSTLAEHASLTYVGANGRRKSCNRRSISLPWRLASCWSIRRNSRAERQSARSVLCIRVGTLSAMCACDLKEHNVSPTHKTSLFYLRFGAGP